VKSVLILIAVFFIVRALKRSLEAKKAVKAAPSGPPPPQKEASASAKQPAEDMALDPVCGSYVPLSAAVKVYEAGRTLHFCSEECREKYSP